MKSIRNILVGSVVGVLIGGSAISAEILGNPPVAPAQAYSSDFDWDGVYVGLGATAGVVTGLGPGVTAAAIDLILGANVTSGNLLFGVEGWVGAYDFDGFITGAQIGAEARVGVLVDDNVLIYTGLGASVTDSGVQSATIGIGAEFVVGENLTLDLEYKYWESLNFPIGGQSLGASLNWYF
ncbi:MAG: hypothetical protein GXP01_00510 [Alphaproteobacteria bacterium]|nr:hypothetical protein [Alphaproteobacteria bacterium]